MKTVIVWLHRFNRSCLVLCLKSRSSKVWEAWIWAARAVLMKLLWNWLISSINRTITLLLVHVLADWFCLKRFVTFVILSEKHLIACTPLFTIDAMTIRGGGGYRPWPWPGWGWRLFQTSIFNLFLVFRYYYHIGWFICKDAGFGYIFCQHSSREDWFFFRQGWDFFFVMVQLFPTPY